MYGQAACKLMYRIHLVDNHKIAPDFFQLSHCKLVPVVPQGLQVRYNLKYQRKNVSDEGPFLRLRIEGFTHMQFNCSVH